MIDSGMIEDLFPNPWLSVTQCRPTSRLVHEPLMRQLQQALQNVPEKRPTPSSRESGVSERAPMASSVVRI